MSDDGNITWYDFEVTEDDLRIEVRCFGTSFVAYKHPGYEGMSDLLRRIGDEVAWNRIGKMMSDHVRSRFDASKGQR